MCSFLLRLQHYSRQHHGRCLFTRLISTRPHSGTHTQTLTHSDTHLGTLASTLELTHTHSHVREEANNLRFWLPRPVHIITTNVAGTAQAGNRQQATAGEDEDEDKAAASARAALLTDSVVP